MRACLLLLATLLVPAPLVPAPLLPAPPARSSGYAVDCPQRCDAPCASGRRCPRTVLDDCGCCRVCAAERGHTCYRTVVGMDGAKCGPGLRCQFYSEEDAFGDEYGICKGKGGPPAAPCPGGARGEASWEVGASPPEDPRGQVGEDQARQACHRERKRGTVLPSWWDPREPAGNLAGRRVLSPAGSDCWVAWVPRGGLPGPALGILWF